MLPRITYSIKKRRRYFILYPFLIHLTLELQNLPRGIEQTPFLLENRAGLTQKQLPKSKHRYCLMLAKTKKSLNLL